jgi:dipeptidase
MIVTPGASADGSVFVSHSDDGHIEADSSVIYIPSAPIARNGRRAVYPTAIAAEELPEYNARLIPRLASDTAAPGYRHPGTPRTLPLAEIPWAEILKALNNKDLAATYAYLDANYGLVNEHGLMFGECTNGAKASHSPTAKRIFYSSGLSELALETCKSAREAVELIGFLIDTYGYYGTGETLPLADAAGEAWVIEISPLPLDYPKAGGLWVAQKVPDGEFFIAANEFRIREIDPAKRGVSQLYGDNLFAVTEELGWAVKDEKTGLLDWLATVSNGEYSHPYYSLRRVWRAFSIVAPSRNFSPWVKNGLTREYPFSVKPDKPLTIEDIKAIHRDHYEGTEFDLTKGMAAGPYGNPNRYLGPDDASGDVGDPNAELIGAWERPIGVYYTNLTYINQARPGVPYPLNVVSWIALNASAESVFLPFAVAPLPGIYQNFDSSVFDLDGQAWQIYNLVGEYANIRYDRMSRHIKSRAGRYENESERLVSAMQTDLAVAAQTKPRDALASFSAGLNDNALSVHQGWRKLFEELVLDYNQGEVNLNAPDGERKLGKVRYPSEWLIGSDYFSGPTVYKNKKSDDAAKD